MIIKIDVCIQMRRFYFFVVFEHRSYSKKREKLLMKSLSSISARHLIAALFLIPVLLLLACGNNEATSSQSTAISTVSTSGYKIKIFSKNQLITSLGIEELQSLPQVSVEVGSDTPTNGPTLQSVLDKAGIKEFTQVTIAGMSKGRIATAETTLQKADITLEVVLDFNKQGKTKLCGIRIPQDQWVIDVSEIRAE
jgi:hypothetical protein